MCTQSVTGVRQGPYPILGHSIVVRVVEPGLLPETSCLIRGVGWGFESECGHKVSLRPTGVSCPRNRGRRSCPGPPRRVRSRTFTSFFSFTLHHGTRRNTPGRRVGGGLQVSPDRWTDSSVSTIPVSVLTLGPDRLRSRIPESRCSLTLE